MTLILMMATKEGMVLMSDRLGTFHGSDETGDIDKLIQVGSHTAIGMTGATSFPLSKTETAFGAIQIARECLADKCIDSGIEKHIESLRAALEQGCLNVDIDITMRTKQKMGNDAFMMLCIFHWNLEKNCFDCCSIGFDPELVPDFQLAAREPNKIPPLMLRRASLYGWGAGDTLRELVASGEASGGLQRHLTDPVPRAKDTSTDLAIKRMLEAFAWVSKRNPTVGTSVDVARLSSQGFEALPGANSQTHT